MPVVNQSLSHTSKSTPSFERVLQGEQRIIEAADNPKCATVLAAQNS